MISKLNICNLALAKLGARPITSLEESSQEARYCKVFYDSSRDAVLRGYSWNFANKNRILASVDVSEGNSRWAYAFGYPADCLKALRVHDDGGTQYPFELGIQDISSSNVRVIFTDLETAYLNYTIRIDNPDLYDSQFIEAFALLLAKELAWPISKSASKEKVMLAKYQLALPKAETADATEQTPSSTLDYMNQEDSWITDRLSG